MGSAVAGVDEPFAKTVGPSIVLVFVQIRIGRRSDRSVILENHECLGLSAVIDSSVVCDRRQGGAGHDSQGVLTFGLASQRIT